MRFEILGPMRAYVGARRITISGERDRTVLAVLLLHAGKPVSVELLTEAVWGDQPPRAARNQLQGCVSRLRKRLAEAGAGEQVIVTDPPGYRIDTRSTDLGEFRQQVERARAAAAEGRHGEARAHYRAGLGLWRDTALAGMDSPLVRRAGAALDDEHIRALEECLQLELSLDGHASEPLAELTSAVHEHPYREGLQGLLMLGLYRAGRPADALAAYQRARRRFREELGVEPGDDLQRLHRAILNRDPALGSPQLARPSLPAARSSIPMELPAPVAGFTGRAEVLQALDDSLAALGTTAPLLITAVAGTAGVGKTALVVQWAHRVADRFPDGQLYLDLHGFSFGPPLRPIDALTALLSSLGTPPDRIPRDEAQASARYRSQLAGRRVLVVLDNAASAEQVRPLLPGSPGCLVLVTSRDRLTGLVARDGARRLTLDVLTDEEAHTLLARLIGAERVGREPTEAAELAKACAFLPLALRIAAAHLIDRPHKAIGALVAELSAGDRLSLMQADEDEQSAVRTALEVSYRRLATDARRMFRLLGLVPGWDFTTAAASALAGTSGAEAVRLFDRLAGAHLIQEHAPGRFTFHDLLRRYGRQLAEQEDSHAERRAALDRLVGWYVRVAHGAVTLLYPHMLDLPEPPAGPAGPDPAFEQPDAALAWLVKEQPNLVAAVVYSAANGSAALALQLAGCLRRYLVHAQQLLDWQTVAVAADAVARREGDLRSQAAARMSLADVDRYLTRLPAATAHYEAALALCRQAGWTDGEAAVLMNAGMAHRDLGQLQQAYDCLTRALHLCREHGWSTGVALNSLGVIDRERGRLADAVHHHDEALTAFLDLGHTVGEADTRAAQGAAYLDLGEVDRARSQLRPALALHRQLGDRQGVAHDLAALAAVELATGNVADALALAEQALVEAIDDPGNSVNALNTLGEVKLRLRLPQVAIDHHRDALDLARQMGAPNGETQALIGLAAAQHCLGQHENAANHAGRAVELAVETGYRLLEARARGVLAEIHLSQAAYQQAHDAAQQALEIHRETGYRPGAARAAALLDLVRESMDRRRSPAGPRSAPQSS